MARIGVLVVLDRLFKWPLNSEDYIYLKSKLSYMRRRMNTLEQRIARDSQELRMLEQLEREGSRVREIRDGIPLGGFINGAINLGFPWDQTRSFKIYLNQHNKTTYCLQLGWTDRGGYTRDKVFKYTYATEAEASKDGYFWVLTGLEPDHYEKEFCKALKGIS